METNLNDQNFKQFLQETEKLILVDFWAEWCGPCQTLGPILEKVIQEYQDKVVLAKVNVDEAPKISQEYGIEQIPTIVLLKDGKPINGFIGLRPESFIKDFIEQAL